MQLWEILLIGIGLSMDAFAVSIGKGLTLPRYQVKYSLITGLWFGGFQALMPTIGYLLGSGFTGYIQSVDHWIAFILLALIGGNMIREAVGGEEENVDGSFSAAKMFPLAVATAIDALAVGVTFAFLDVSIVQAALLIGCTTFVFGFAGVKIGAVFGEKYAAKAEIAGGVILILLGAKILLEHLGVFG